MAKTASKTPASKTSKKTTGAPKTDISFGAWVKTVARARGAEGELLKELRADKKITDKSTLKRAQALHGTGPLMYSLTNRYGKYLARGSQSKAA